MLSNYFVFSLAVVKTGEEVIRETHLNGAILTRVALSHIRGGTFQYIAAREKKDELETLLDYINRIIESGTVNETERIGSLKHEKKRITREIKIIKNRLK